MIYKSIGTFRVFSSTYSLVEIENILNMKSAGGYSKGDPISKKNPNSKVHIDSLWTLVVKHESEAGQDASVLIDGTLAELLLDVNILLPRIGNVDLHCDIHAAVFSNNEQINCYLSRSTIQLLASADMEVMLSGYMG